MRIALIVDNPYRDLPGMVLVAQRLCALGATCYLVPTNLEWREVGALAPDFVLLTNIRRPRQEFARRLIEAGIKVGVLDNEGGVMPDFQTYAKMTGPDPALFAQISCFCTWGPQLAEYASMHRWYLNGQVTVTGAPRFDFYAPQRRKAALAASSQLADYRSPLILINGSFPRANPRFQSPEGEIQSWAALGFTREYMLRFQSIEREALHEMAKVANHVARRFPEATVVYRPHPFERVDTYESLLDKRENLRLLKIGTVEGWILRADVVIHRNSTTAIEAAMAGVPALLPTWIPVAEKLEACDAVSLKCGSLEALDDHICRALAGTENANAELKGTIDGVIRDWFHIIDGNAHERVADAIFGHTAGFAPSVGLVACRRIHYGWRPAALTLRSRVGIAARMVLRVSVTWSFVDWSNQDPGVAWAQSEKAFDAGSVRALVEAISDEGGEISVAQAQGRDYCVPYAAGRSVAIRPHHQIGSSTSARP